MLSTPPSTMASASPTFWQHTPTAPRAICRRPITAHLCVFACGLRRTPLPATALAILSRLRWKASSSISRAGVSTSLRGAPISAGGGCIMGSLRDEGLVVAGDVLHRGVEDALAGGRGRQRGIRADAAIGKPPAEV